MPVCKNCLNYVLKLPCPHCGKDESLTSRKDISPLNSSLDSEKVDFSNFSFSQPKSHSQLKSDDDFLKDFIKKNVDDEDEILREFINTENITNESVLATKTKNTTKFIAPRGAIKTKNITQRKVTAIPSSESTPYVQKPEILKSSPKKTKTPNSREIRTKKSKEGLLAIEHKKQTANTVSQVLNTTSPKLKVGSNLSLSSKLPEAIADVSLSATEQKLYYQLSIEYQIILDESTNFHQGMYNWNQLLPKRLDNYGLDKENWERIANIGDTDERMQEKLKVLLKKYFP